MFPIVISDSQISRFNYWDSSIKEGMFFKDQIYTLVKQFDSENRLKAFTQGCQICGQGIPACITVTNSNYTLWQGLRSQFKSSNSN